ncbi:MAG: FAD-dependent oxidoreductase, partial [Pseudomonadota bacterium]
MHDVAVIGGGVLGLSVAYACLARGLSTAVYEAGRVGDGASGGIVGALSPHSPDRWNAKKAFQLAALRAAPSFWGQIEQESGRPTGYAQTGRVMLLTSARARAKAEAQAAEAALRWGGATWAVTEAPDWLAPSLHGVVRESLSAKLFPRLAVRALAEAVRRRGGEIHEQTPVRAEGPGFATSASPLSARRMVIAAGLPGFRLAGLGDLGDSVKGQAALLDVALPAGRPMVYGDGLYILGQGRQVAVGSTSEPGV